MKKIRNKTLIGAVIMTLFLTLACNDVLDEQPRSIYEPGYFKTEKGVLGGITAMYAHLRYITDYGGGLIGTDEATFGQLGGQGNFMTSDMTPEGGQLNSTNAPGGGIWGYGFSNINTANGVIEYAGGVGLSAALIAEVYFFRAFDYFQLVQTFGGVPLDLGAGELKFNTSTARTSVRNTVPEVYTKAIFPDLITAINDLPTTPRVTGGVTKTVARLYLSKAYLTYAWWLENPGNIPTYPECARTDPDGHDAAWYFQQAYNIATQAIDDPGPYGLLDNFYEVNLGGNDRNKETMLYADHTESSEFYNGATLTGMGGGVSPENAAVWFMTWNYTEILSAMMPDGTIPVNSVQRDAIQALGRPWTRMCPTIGVIEKTFANKTEDSRYDGTFSTVYRGNWQKAAYLSMIPTMYNIVNFMPVNVGEPVLTFLPDESLASQITYSSDAGPTNVGAGTIPGRADYVVSPRGISRYMYPGLWKLGVYRTDNGTGYGAVNAPSSRPFYIAKFSEFYFIAAEAAVKGAATQAGKSARELINVLRARAGKWKFSNAENKAKTDDYSATMTAATPQQITIDYILEERSREYYGEAYRWYDLVRTQKWAEISTTYEICDGVKGAHTPKTYTRTINPYHYLRPIPQGQLDAMEMSDAEKKAYQNPGYN